MTDYWRPVIGRDTSNAASDDPMDWPDSPERRLALGHRDERTVPGYCTCGELTKNCPVNPREWVR